MTPLRITKAVLTFLSAISFQLVFSASLSAQAWLPTRGEGTDTIGYENFYVKNHLDSDGNRFFDGTIRASGLFQEVDYGLTRRVALDVSLPYIRAKYNGIDPHQLPIDGGNYHGTFQDFHFNIRYNLRARPLQVTPFFEAIIPSHSYEYFAHSGVGSRLREFQFGVNVGRRLDAILPRSLNR